MKRPSTDGGENIAPSGERKTFVAPRTTKNKPASGGKKKAASAADLIKRAGGKPVSVHHSRGNAAPSAPRTFTVTLDVECAERLAELCDEFRHVTAEAFIVEAANDAANSFNDSTYYFDMARAVADRARAEKAKGGAR